MRLSQDMDPQALDLEGLVREKKFSELISLLNHPEFDIHQQAAAHLGSMGMEAINHLLPALTHSNRNIRLGIIEALGEIKDLRSIPALIPLLNDPSEEVRWATALALGEIGSPKSENALFTALADSDKYVRYGAAIALEKIGWVPRTTAERAYYLIGKQEWGALTAMGEEVVEPLRSFLRDRDADVRFHVIEALGDIGGSKAREYCRYALSDANTEVRWAGVLSGLKCGSSLIDLPLGVSKRPRGEKNALVAGFLNFIFPGAGYMYLGAWWGYTLWNVYILVLLSILLFINQGFPLLPSIFMVFYPLYGWLSMSAWLNGVNVILFMISFGLSAHAWYRVKTAPDLL